MSKTRCRPRMLLHVINIPFIAPHSTHAAPQLPQSRNISFPANSYPLKRRKFHYLSVHWAHFLNTTGSHHQPLAPAPNLSSLSANCTPQLSLTNIDQFCAAINTPYDRYLAINQGNYLRKDVDQLVT